MEGRRSRHYTRGFGTYDFNHVTQANEGCDLSTSSRRKAKRRRPPIPKSIEPALYKEPDEIPIAFALLAVCAFAQPALSQDYPSKPITYVVPFTPGGTTDVVGRTIAQESAPALGQPVVVDNKPAGGRLGARQVAKAKPDGYTLLGGTISTHAINAGLYKNLRYDPVKDFEPITLVGFIPNALYVNANCLCSTVQELIALLKQGQAAHLRIARRRARPRTWPASSSPT